MTQNLNPEFVHLELGDYLELLQNTIPVGGKRLERQRDLPQNFNESPDLW